MTSPPAIRRNRNVLLGLLLGIAILAPVLIDGSKRWPVPTWVVGLVGPVALVGALAVLWRQGAMRGRYLAVVILALPLLAALGWYMREHS